MYYLQSRYYDPQIGRFINADATAIIFEREVDYFTYCNNVPSTHTDPTGMKPKDDQMGILKWTQLPFATYYYKTIKKATDVTWQTTGMYYRGKSPYKKEKTRN